MCASSSIRVVPYALIGTRRGASTVDGFASSFSIKPLKVGEVDMGTPELRSELVGFEDFNLL